MQAAEVWTRFIIKTMRMTSMTFQTDLLALLTKWVVCLILIQSAHLFRIILLSISMTVSLAVLTVSVMILQSTSAYLTILRKMTALQITSGRE